MNKRLRRILRRRPSTRNTPTLQQNSSERSTLTSLLTERSSAKPNYYFRTNSSIQSESVLKNGDEKANEKTILIVEEGSLVAEKVQSAIEIDLQPMNKETPTQSCEDASNEDGNLNPRSKTDSSPSAIEGTKKSFNFYENGNSNFTAIGSDQKANLASDIDKLKSDPRLIKSFRKEENPYSLTPKSTSQNVFNNSTKPVPKKETTNEPPRLSSSNNDHLPQETNQTLHEAKTECDSSSEIQILTSSRPRLASPGKKRGSPTFEMVLAPCEQDTTVTTETFFPSTPSRMEDLKLWRSESLTEKILSRPPKVRSFAPHFLIKLPDSISESSTQDNCSPSPAFKQPPSSINPACHQRLHPQDSCDHHFSSFPHHHQLVHSRSPWCISNLPEHRTCPCMHGHGHERHSFFHCCSGHGCNCCTSRSVSVCGECSWNKPRFQMKKQFRHHSCHSTRHSSSHSHEDSAPTNTISPVIFVSIPGETQAKAVSLPSFLSADESANFEQSMSMDCDIVESQHRTQTIHECMHQRQEEACCCTDYRHNWERGARMAPSVTLMSNLQETINFSTEMHCSCCYRIIRERKDNHFEQPCPDKSSVHHSVHQYSNCNNTHTGVQRSLGHFEISPRSYTKLLAYIKNMQATMRRRRISGEHFENRSNFHGMERHSINCGNELMFLNRKPTRAHNEYSTFTERTLSASAYQNQTIADTVQLAKVLETVEECPWYWGEMSNVEAKQALRGHPIGTFVLRDSSDPRYLFSVSVMTSRGPTSIRVVYSDGYFRFDSDGDKASLSGQKPSASSNVADISKHRRCVVHMILHYTNHLQPKTDKSGPTSDVETLNSDATSSDEINTTTTNTSGANDKSQFLCSWIGRNGKKVMSVSMSQPLPKTKMPTLQQLSRSYVNKHLNLWTNIEQVNDMSLPISLQKYLKKYPYPV